MATDKVGMMGWGDKTDHPSKTLYRERIAFEVCATANPERRVPFEVFSMPSGESAIEQELRKLMEFDEGWDFLVAEKLLYGDNMMMNQNIGNCVGASHCMLLAAKVAHEILLEGDPEDVLGTLAQNSPMPWIPYSYGAGRVYIGGNRIRGDGSLCEWQIQASMEHGFLPSDYPGLGDVPQGAAATGRLLGSSKLVLDKYRPEAIKFDLEQSVDVRDADQAKEIVTVAKHPLQICSGWSFGFQGKDKNGINLYKRTPEGWAHSMQIVAIFAINGQWYAKVRNQWGNAHKDGITFTIPFELFAQWIKQANCASIGELKGRPARVEFGVV